MNEHKADPFVLYILILCRQRIKNCISTMCNKHEANCAQANSQLSYSGFMHGSQSTWWKDLCLAFLGSAAFFLSESVSCSLLRISSVSYMLQREQYRGNPSRNEDTCCHINFKVNFHVVCPSLALPFKPQALEGRKVESWRHFYIQVLGKKGLGQTRNLTKMTINFSLNSFTFINPT